MNRIFRHLILAVCLIGAAAAAETTPAVDRSCNADGSLHYLCGPQNAEDIVPLANSRWLVASGLNPKAMDLHSGPGHLYLIDRNTKTAREWFPGTAPAMRLDKKTFGACPGPLNIHRFAAHGLSVRAQGAHRYRLYMTSHGEREAIEAFDIDTAGAQPSLTWVGCVVLPDNTFANAVAMLADGGFVATRMMDANADVMSVFASGQNSGYVYEWHPGGAVTKVPGTDLPMPNGIEVSRDERWLFVAATSTRELVRFDRRARQPATRIQLDVMVDNLRWGDDGKLYTVGGLPVSGERFRTCAPPCATGWAVYAIDSATLQATQVMSIDSTAALQGASTAAVVGQEIWIGTYAGTRVGYAAKP